MTSRATPFPPAAVAAILALAIAIYNKATNQPDTKLPDTIIIGKEYDYVLIGGGSAGPVVGNRLTEIPEWSVLLLEAGGQETDISDVPVMAAALQRTELDWQYLTEPPTHHQYCQAMNNYQCRWPSGKVVGGTSVISFMLYVRGNKRDYDHWEELGNTDWGYRHVLKYFKKSEDNLNSRLVNSGYHATGGYLSVQDPRYETPLADIFLEGGKHLGYETVDINGEEQMGFTNSQGTLRHGSRCSTSKAFVRPILHRENFHLSMNSFVTKIDFEDFDNPQGPRATTVHFTKNNKHYTVRAKKEIILCAGAIASPQLLMVSGVGPADHLREFGIKVIKDLKVGYNLQDHVSAGTLLFKIDKPYTLKSSTVVTPQTIMEYLFNKSGPLTSMGTAEGLAFIKSKYADASSKLPDLQFQFLSSSIYGGPQPFGYMRFNVRSDLFNRTGYQTLPNEQLFTIFPTVLHPKSRGRIKLQSADPHIYPKIEPNYFSSKEDLDLLINGMEIAMKLAETPPFKRIGTAPVKFPFPGCEGHELFTRSYFECCIRQFTFTLYHPTSTCAMGVGPDAVVDPQLRVHGVRSLRVMDSSTMPEICSGATLAPTIMIAEKGSDMVKAAWLH